MEAILARLATANAAVAARYPGATGERQPAHTVYGGAQLFKEGTTKKLGELALKSLLQHAPDAQTFAKALGVSPAVYDRVKAKLQREAVEDYRIDFEDGFGIRPDAEEDDAARNAARELAKALASGSLPPFVGFRVKTLSEELKHRAVRTLDLFMKTLVGETKGKLPPQFFITLPKVTSVEHVAAFCDLLAMTEASLGLTKGALKLEIMIETTQALLGPDGTSPLPRMAAAAQGRLVAAHLGAYDYTASVDVTSAAQTLDHPACDFARHMMQVAFAGTPVWLADGATNVMPVGDTATVHRAWALHFKHVRHALKNGFYQGWDLHPAQLPARYGALYAFFLDGLPAATERLKAFIDKATQATLLGDVFDDAATGQGLLNFFLRGVSCGALGEDEVRATGLTSEEVRTRSFVQILARRKTQ